MGVSSCSVALVVVMMAIAADGVVAGVTGALPTQVLRERIVLDQKGRYVMLWTPQENDIIIEVQVATAGYVGLGFSPKGGMKGADIVMGWVDDSGRVMLHDQYSDGYTVPKVDESQDVELLGGYQNDTHTVLRFSRPWVTCDHNDIRLSGDTVRLVWFFANEDPTDDMTMKDHDQQGERSILLKEPTFVAPTLDDHTKAWELLAPNVTLPHDLDTLYWCKLFKIPPIKSKNQFIGYTPVIQEGNEQYVHHMVLFECKLPKSSLHYEKWLGVEGLQCYSSSMPRSWNHCKTPIMAWAVGSAGEMFPEHVGFPMGEEYDGATYYRMEVHYDNKDLKQGIVDASGLRMFYTDILRPHDAATVGFGHLVSPLHIIPPGQRNWFTVGFCSGECTQQLLPPDGIHVFQGLLHSHLLGRAISLRQIRNGRELPPLLVDKSYDFNYQQGRILRDEMTILPGDSFITECDYDSGDRPNPTFGGLGTYEEMCVVYMSFYPRVNVTMCGSIPQPKNIYKSLGIEEMEEKQHYDAKHM
ncbi:DBH-like monooxygenase protein 1 homolog [Panulirus ornatus]|uniref:DBH-like monooxygenase protein 1 homolog n=1 Tax=Panulirus ornatus TaxID=150431 RepID=UPI003A8B9EB5